MHTDQELNYLIKSLQHHPSPYIIYELDGSIAWANIAAKYIFNLKTLDELAVVKIDEKITNNFGDLDSIALAARSLGIRKMKREANQSHPKRPRAREGYLVMSAKDAHSAAGTNSKEELMAAIGSRLATTHQEAKEKAEEERKRGPRKGDRAARSQRKAKRPQNKKNKRRQNRR